MISQDAYYNYADADRTLMLQVFQLLDVAGFDEIDIRVRD